MEITAQSVSHALWQGVSHLLRYGAPEPSRNGPVLVSPTPVMTIYEHPERRVLFSPVRDANPFFHLMESLWMLGGRQDIAFPRFFNSRFGEYSDDGRTSPGAYGFRWRKHFHQDQLKLVVEELRENPASRRAVLTMWDAIDLPRLRKGTVDVPCNTAIYFDARNGKLNMTVTCRSNDILWGAYGANAVHFSMLQEYLAVWLGLPMGVYRQFSNNFHLYTKILPLEKCQALLEDLPLQDCYMVTSGRPLVVPYPLAFEDIKLFDEDLHQFLDFPRDAYHEYQTPFFEEVAMPMYHVWLERKEKRGSGLGFARTIVAEDWRLACMEWINRREKK